jgi:hypothetical protein
MGRPAGGRTRSVPSSQACDPLGSPLGISDVPLRDASLAVPSRLVRTNTIWIGAGPVTAIPARDLPPPRRSCRDHVLTSIALFRSRRAYEEVPPGGGEGAAGAPGMVRRIPIHRRSPNLGDARPRLVTYAWIHAPLRRQDGHGCEAQVSPIGELCLGVHRHRIAQHLSQIPYEAPPRAAINLSARRPRSDDKESTHPLRYVAEAY